ncbi:MAG: AAA family ATPase [Acidobacteria bacterium]|nr:MAG: AAA family ATPase [Acidobacteriota bacterium]
MRDLKERAQGLKLHGLLAHWKEIHDQPWLPDLLEWEETERARRGLERRMRQARLGSFKPLDDFDWSWPKKIDRAQIDDLFRLEWLHAATNVVLVGPNGVGKTMIAKNLVQHAVLSGVTARYLTASELLNTLAEQETGTGLQRKLTLFARPHVLLIDELGYLSYDTRHADLLFEIVSRRYERRPTLITTNKPFAEWGGVDENQLSHLPKVKESPFSTPWKIEHMPGWPGPGPAGGDEGDVHLRPAAPPLRRRPDMGWLGIAAQAAVARPAGGDGAGVGCRFAGGYDRLEAQSEPAVRLFVRRAIERRKGADGRASSRRRGDLGPAPRQRGGVLGGAGWPDLRRQSLQHHRGAGHAP